MRKADRELMEKRQEDIKQIIVESFDKKARELTDNTIAKAKAFDIIRKYVPNIMLGDKQIVVINFGYCCDRYDLTQEEYNLLKEVGVEEE